MPGLTEQDIIRMLGLKPHPEGGYFRETFRDSTHATDGRAASTAAYYLLARGERSHWHRLDAAEIWHWYAGAPAKGLVFFAAIVGPLVVGTELDLTVIGAAVGIPLDIGGLGLWAFCAYDAYRTARNRMRPAA